MWLFPFLDEAVSNLICQLCRRLSSPVQVRCNRHHWATWSHSSNSPYQAEPITVWPSARRTSLDGASKWRMPVSIGCCPVVIELLSICLRLTQFRVRCAMPVPRQLDPLLATLFGTAARNLHVPYKNCIFGPFRLPLLSALPLPSLPLSPSLLFSLSLPL